MTSDFKKYLVPSVVARLSNIELKAKSVVEGFMAGLHKSPYHGFSVEFAEHRQYMPGDDLKFLDWKVYARTGRFYIKRFEEETNLKSYILLDISKSMDFSSGENKQTEERKGLAKLFGKSKSPAENSKAKLTKLEYGSYIAASLAYLMLLQRDAISLTTYDTQIQNYIHPRATDSNLKLILHGLNNIQSTDKTGTARCLNEIADKVKRRGLVVVISDLFDDQREVMSALRHFKYSKNEVIVFQILDPLELSFLSGNPVTLKDLETHEEMFSQPFVIQKAYQEAVREFITTYKNECAKSDIDYIMLSTENTFDKVLINYLTKRMKMM
ncbi:MAG: DUF58 domain-containing protein [Ignavibacteria bacterium]|nr:DUF58 domain-containing protein [Ignavibacteria bacterium]